MRAVPEYRQPIGPILRNWLPRSRRQGRLPSVAAHNRSQMEIPAAIRDVDHLEELLSEPSPAAIDAIPACGRRHRGARGRRQDGTYPRGWPAARLILPVHHGASSASPASQSLALEGRPGQAQRIETIRCDLLDDRTASAATRLTARHLHGGAEVRIERPGAADVGDERGAASRNPRPRRYAGSRIAAFSTGNEWDGLTPVSGGGGSRETDPTPHRWVSTP